MPTISVIVPVYNAEKYLARCIDSILAQTYRDFELLLIDDGSTDSSGNICDVFAQQDTRIRVFHKKNGGVSSARFYGLAHGTGKWVAFIDSDDVIGNYYLSWIMTPISEDTDIIVCCDRETKMQNISSKEFISGLLRNRIPWYVHSKLYRKSCFYNIEEIERRFSVGEDLIQNLTVAGRTNSIALITNCGYFYQANKESVTHTRIFSEEYESLFIDKVLNLIPNQDIYAQDIWLFLFRTYKNLVLNGEFIGPEYPWVKEVFNNPHKSLLSFQDKLLLHIKPGSQMNKIFLLCHKIKRLLHNIKEIL